MKLGRAVDPNFNRVLSKLASEPMPLNVAINIKKTIDILSKEFAEYEELRKNIIEKYSLKNNDGSIRTDDNGNAELASENQLKFAEEISNLLNKEITIPVIDIKETNKKSTNLYTAEEIFILDELFKY